MRLICEHCEKEIKKADAISVDFQGFKKLVGIEGYENAYFCSLECARDFFQKKIDEINKSKEGNNEMLPED